MNREELKKILPHREPMLLLDEAEAEENTAKGKYLVRGDEFFLQGHFPGSPVVPGVILCEMMAQSTCVLLKNELHEGKKTLYTGIDKARFRSPVYPGDQIEISCSILRERTPFYFARGTVSVNEKICATSDFSFALI